MQVEVLMVANQAAIDNGMLSVIGAGWEHYRVTLFPDTLRGCVAGISTLSPDELGETVEIGFSLTDSAGHVSGSAGSMIISGIRPTTIAGVPVRVPFVLPFSTVVSGPTIVNVGVTHGTDELAAVTFAVLDPIPDSPSG